MTMYVYGTDGEPRGFLFETTIYALDGRPLGRILGSRVHRFDGAYAGEWYQQMVVDRPSARPRTIPPVAPPPPRAPAPVSWRRRHVAEYGLYPDAFDRLLGNDSLGEMFEQAAE
jgi:hypothetical protein